MTASPRSKAQLLQDLRAEHDQFEALLDAIGAGRFTQPTSPDQWSIKDIVAHLTGWRRRTVQRFQAIGSGQALPPPWPAHLTTDEDINAGLHAQTRDHSVEQVRSASRQVFADLLAAIEALPEDVLKDAARFPFLEGQPLSARALFGHFHDEHEADMRAWLAAAP